MNGNILLLALLVLSTARAQETITKENVLEEVQHLDPYLRATRAYLHEHPELSGKEHATSAFLQAEIARLGLPVTPVPGTGFYALLDTHRPGRTIGLRTDIDALPIDENRNNLRQPKKYLSKNKGISHTCGHDGHMAILLAAARILTAQRHRLAGRIVFIFEEGEETGSGIDAMIDALRPLGIDAIYGNHLKSNLPTGRLFVRQGAIMAGTGTVAFDVVGRGGHASRPDLSINPVFAAANVLTALSIAWNNQRDITKTVTLGITQFQAGDVYNVIPNSAYLGGTIRFFDREEADRCFALIRSLSRAVAGAHNCTVDFRLEMGIRLDPVVNDPALTAFARQTLEEIYPSRVTSDEQYVWYAAETFSRYSLLAPTVFIFAGIQNDALGSGAEHHNDRFDLDDDALHYALGAMLQFTVKYLGE
jgi:amidohydrolase